MSALLFDLRASCGSPCIPAVIAVALLAFGVEEPPHRGQAEKKPGFDLRTASALGTAFWQVTAVGALP